MVFQLLPFLVFIIDSDLDSQLNKCNFNLGEVGNNNLGKITFTLIVLYSEIFVLTLPIQLNLPEH